MNRREFLATGLAAAAPSGGAIPLFDGRTLNGWKANAPGSWRVEEGTIVASGPRSHLFYTAREFKNFEFSAEVLTAPGANSGIYFHSKWVAEGWPTAQGFEVQINNTHRGEGNYRERKKTGSLYGVRNVYKALAKDGEWFPMEIAVRGKQVEIRANGLLVVDYVEPDPPVGRAITAGAFALQCHDPGSVVRFRNLRVRPLPDDLPTAGERPVADGVYRQILDLGGSNYPMVDYHVHLKGGFNVEQALAESRKLGIFYGFAVNCGLGFPVSTDSGAEEFLRTMRGVPAFVAMQGEGREWVKLFSAETRAKFDYCFSDSMTWTDDKGKRMRLWMPHEVGEITDVQHFMDLLVDRTVGVLHEPIDIYVNPTFLPVQIAKDYDRLWTPERMRKVVDALVKNGVAMEINNRYRLPSPAFIKMAKQAGAKFAFGTNNADANIGRLEYPLEMVKECGLTWQDIFVPKGQRAG
ncbi:MAG: family 16 glycoside hydrolase [Bryobacteraceae bacterium]